MLSRAEFLTGSATRLNMSESEATTLFDKLDVNRDGVLSHDEFQSIELEGSLFSLSGLAYFLQKNLQSGPAKGEMASPGRWTLSTEKFEKESRRDKQYYD